MAVQRMTRYEFVAWLMAQAVKASLPLTVDVVLTKNNEYEVIGAGIEIIIRDSIAVVGVSARKNGVILQEEFIENGRRYTVLGLRPAEEEEEEEEEEEDDV